MNRILFLIAALVVATGSSANAEELIKLQAPTIEELRAELREESRIVPPSPSLDGLTIPEPKIFDDEDLFGGKLSIYEEREPAPRLRPVGWVENIDFVAGAGSGASNSAKWGFHYAEVVARYVDVAENAKLGLRFLKSGFSGSTDEHFSFNGTTVGFALAGLFETYGLSSDTQTTFWVGPRWRTDEGKNNGGGYKMEQKTTEGSWYFGHNIFYPRKVVPELDLYFAGDVDFNHKKKSSSVVGGQRVRILSGDPAENKGNFRIGWIADLMRFGEGLRSITPGVGLEYSVNKEDDSKRWVPQVRVGLLGKHVYMNAGRSYSQDAADSWFAGATFAAWEF